MNLEELKELIPKDKFDKKRATELNNYSIEELRPIINDLLYCLADINWPISQPVSEYLLQHNNDITSEILEILKGNDEVWKYWLIQVFGAVTTDERLKNEIIRLSKFPTKSEQNEEVDLISKDIIEMRNW